MDFLEQIKFDNNGLIPAIAQDYQTGEILMFAYMNQLSVEITVDKNIAVYFSRSRNKLWYKGEESGYIQEVKQILTDCDKDVLILKIKQIGGISCHTGRKSCFFHQLKNKQWVKIGKVLKNPDDIYQKYK